MLTEISEENESVVVNSILVWIFRLPSPDSFGQSNVTLMDKPNNIIWTRNMIHNQDWHLYQTGRIK